jgi:hypothetical protein
MKPQLFLLKLIFLAAMIAAYSVNGQEKQDSSGKALYKEIARQDSILFNAFNKRDIEQFKTLFTEDLEFYHDKGGLTGYQHSVDFLKDISNPGNDLRRELVKGTLEVYPIPGYGAMEIGSHNFCHTENGKQDCGTFKFVHIWQKKDGKWKISRVVSYDH